MQIKQNKSVSSLAMFFRRSLKILEMKKKINVYLYGIGGIYNYGCEAMIRAISGRIKNEEPNSTITYKTYNYEYDKKLLADCETVKVSALDVHARNSSFNHKLIRSLKFIKKKMNIAKEEDRLPYNTEWLEDCDYLIIIGGDVFDLLPGQTKGYDNERIWASKAAKKHNSKIILWGISIGNFEANPTAKKILFDYLKNVVDVAVIRDEKSLEYLKKNGITNAFLCADPAYMLRTEQTTLESIDNTKTLGVNLSPLANRYLNVKLKDDQWPVLWSDILIDIYNRYNYQKILLLPHVVNENNPSDDDYNYLMKIKSILSGKGINVEIAPKHVGFIGIKKYLIKCNLIMSARMHCSVNAITCGVPTLFLSYSPKSVGMCQFVYGNTDYVVDMNELSNNIDYDLFDRIDRSSDEIRSFLSVRNEELCELSRKAISYLDMKER